MNKISKPEIKIGHKRGVVGVVVRGDKFLVIRRSKHVTAPGKLCFPGGTMEKGETEQQTLVREMMEETALEVTPVKLCWRSVTPWGTSLAWWQASIPDDALPIPDPTEVEECFWMNTEKIYHAKDALPSLPAFMDACFRGEVDLIGTLFSLSNRKPNEQ